MWIARWVRVRVLRARSWAWDAGAEDSDRHRQIGAGAEDSTDRQPAITRQTRDPPPPPPPTVFRPSIHSFQAPVV